VHKDELRLSWKIFTPLLHALEKKKVKPTIYKTGVRTCPGFDDFLKKRGWLFISVSHCDHVKARPNSSLLQVLSTGTVGMSTTGMRRPLFHRRRNRGSAFKKPVTRLFAL